MLRALLLLLFPLAVAASVRAQPEVGVPLMSVYLPRDYGDFGQCFGAVQDRSGMLYVGSRGCLVTFDGHAWGEVRIPDQYVRGIAIDRDDRIWTAGAKEIGYLDDDGKGGRIYVSLIAKLPAELRAKLDILHIYVQPDGVFFFSRTHVLRWQGGRFEVEAVPQAWPMQIGGQLCRHRAGEPIEVWQGGAWRPYLDAPELRKDVAHFLAPLPDGGRLVGMRRSGFWRASVDGSLAPFPTEVDDLAKGPDGFDRGLVLRDGNLALNFRPNGMAIVDPKGKRLHFMSAERGVLPSSTPWNFLQDRRGDLWALLETGMARIEWPVRATVLQLAPDVKVQLAAVRRHRGRLYAATKEGLCVVQPHSRLPARLEPVPESRRFFHTLATAGDDLLLGEQGGVSVLEPHAVAPRLVYRESAPVRSLWASPRDPTSALAGTTTSLSILRKEAGAWRKVETIPEVKVEIWEIMESADGSIWAMTLNQGVFRLRGLPGTGSAAEPRTVEHYPNGHGLRSESGPAFVQVVNGVRDLAFFNRGYRFHFDAAQRRFVEEYHLPGRIPVPTAEFIKIGTGTLGDGALWPTFSHAADAAAGPARGRALWHIDPEGKPRLVARHVTDLAGTGVRVFEEVDAEGQRVAWLSGNDNLVRALQPQVLAKPIEFRTVFRRIADEADRPVALAPAKAESFPYERRSFTVTVSTDRLDTPNLRYQSRLDNGAWTAWKAERTFHFDRLPAGSHRIAIRARDHDGNVSAPATYALAILPPWWATWWASTLYAVVIAVALVGFVRWRLGALQRRNVQLEALVAARTKELNAAKLGAEAANHAKSAFLANMSHELRTPLNAILGFAQILRRAPDLSTEHRQRLAVIGRNGDHLLQLINEVLDLSKIEAGKLALAPRPVALLPLLHGLAETYAARAGDKGLRFESSFAPDLPARIVIDDAKLRQVLHNLLGNAVKFTASGKVAFTVTSHRAHSLRFEVSDTGPGIAADALADVFEAFYQAADRKLAAQGTGLGLTISQRFVHLMGGRIEVSSTPGSGSRFWFDISPSVPANGTPSAAPLQPITGYLGRRRRLLVVDDEAANRDVLRGMLEPLGFEIEESADSASCLTAFQRERFDAILLDLRMGAGPDGYATARTLRSLPGGRELAIIAVSASVFEEDRQTALDAGCDAFLPKPFTEERLLAALREHLPLEWTFADAAESDRETAAAPTATLPPAALADLLAIAHRGDFDAFRERLVTIAAAHPDCAATVRRLDGLAANFQLGALRQALRQAGASSDSSSA